MFQFSTEKNYFYEIPNQGCCQNLRRLVTDHLLANFNKIAFSKRFQVKKKMNVENLE